MDVDAAVTAVQRTIAEASALQLAGAILALMVVAGIAYGGYTVVTGDVDDPSSSVRVIDTSCSVTAYPNGLNRYNVELQIENRIDRPINASDVTVTLYNPETGATILIEDVYWQRYAFAQGTGTDTVTVSTSTERGDPVTDDPYYNVSIRFPAGTVDAGQCPEENMPTRNTDDENTSTTEDNTTDIDEGAEDDLNITDLNVSDSDDTTPPSTTVSYTDTGWKAQPQHITLSCTDTDTGCVYVQWRVESAAGLSNVTTVEQGETTATVGADHDGVINLWYRGIDGAGNREGWSAQQLRIDTTPPTTTLSAGDIWYSDDIVRIVDDSTTGPSGLSHCEYRVNDGNTSWTNWRNRSCGSVSVSIGGSGECSTEGADACTVQVRAWSNAGLNATDTASFNIDFSAPTTTILSPDAGTEFADDFTVDVNDSGTNLDTCEYQVEDVETGVTAWQSRTCPDGGFTVAVGDTDDCQTEGNDTCVVTVRVNDTDGRSASDQRAYSINFTNETSGNGTGNETGNETGTELTWSTHRIATTADWNQGMFEGTTALTDTLQIGYVDRSDGLVGYWRMDGTSGSVTDYSGTGNDGTNNGAMRGSTGVFGTDAFSFDGTSDYVTVEDDPSLDADLSALTVSVWVRFASATTDSHEQIVKKQKQGPNPYILRRSKQERIVLSGEGFDYTDTDEGFLRDTDWHHIVGTVTDSASRIYVDGEEVATGNGGNITDGEYALAFGASSITDDDFLEGTLDEIRIYDRGLSSAEVDGLYFSGRTDNVFDGDYASSVINTDQVQNWSTVEVDASVSNSAVDASMTFEALDSSGTVQDQETFQLSDGIANYTLSVGSTEDARLRFSGTSSDPERTWRVNTATVHYNH